MSRGSTKWYFSHTDCFDRPRSNAIAAHDSLDIAGAAGLVAEIADELADTQSDDEPNAGNGAAPTPAPEADKNSTEEAAPPPRGITTPASPPVPLLLFEDLTIDGNPVAVFGESREDQRVGDSGGRRGGPGSGHSSRAAAGTDLAALDLLGMRIAMGYEVRRLRRQGLVADVLLPEGGPVDSESLVVDVHSPEAIRLAEASSAVVKQVMADLESRGISRLFPGFDILSIGSAKADRLIELKSSGQMQGSKR